MQIETISKMIGRIWSLSRGIPRRLSVKMLKSNSDTVLLLLSESFTVYIPTKRKWPARSCGLQNWFENCQNRCRWYEFDLELKRSFGNNSMVLSFSWPHGLLSEHWSKSFSKRVPILQFSKCSGSVSETTFKPIWYVGLWISTVIQTSVSGQ